MINLKIKEKKLSDGSACYDLIMTKDGQEITIAVPSLDSIDRAESVMMKFKKIIETETLEEVKI